MSRLTAPSFEEVPENSQAVLERTRTQFGFIPNMFSTLAGNPAVLDIVMGLQASIARLLDAKTRHTIALAVSHANGCDYCQAMHTYTSSTFGKMPHDDIDLALEGSSVDPKRAAVARFAQRVVATRGQVSDADLAAIRGAGYTDAQILAIVTISVVYLLTNFINNVNQTDVDIPAVDLSAVSGN